ncbi:DsbE family thiol:disulfide interchange protein [Beijerinckiaceae bacterium]|nr:DsbE family thiol:disulfide interchange protein [Beijerinckiaceae bacterium]
MAATEPRPEARSPARRPLLIYVPLIVFAALAGLFFVRLYSGDASLLPSAMIGRQVPSFTLPPVEGLADKPGFSDTDFRQGKVTLVNVFASWCVPCHQEHALIMRLSKDATLARAGIQVFGLAYKDEPANIRRFLSESGDPYARIGADRKGRTAIDWGVYGVPETYIVKGDGTIAYRFVGPMSDESYRDVILPEIEKALR